MAKVVDSSVWLRPELLGPNARVTAYAQGNCGPNPRRTSLLILMGSIALVSVTALIGALVIPGALLLWLVYVSIETPVYVVTTDASVAIVQRSVVNGKPSHLLGTYATVVLGGDQIERDWGLVHLPSSNVWIKEQLFDRVRQGVGELTGVVGQPPPGWYPLDNTPEQRMGYWDGYAWVAQGFWVAGEFRQAPIWTPQ
jgi:hypothetical protein